MQTRFFRINSKEYCHISDDKLFIINSKEVIRVPLEHSLGEGWGIISILNYLIFAFLFVYTALSITHYKLDFFVHPMNYGALILLLIAFRRVKEGFQNSRTPMIPRHKIRDVEFRTPKFSYPRLIIYFNGPEGKVLRKMIPVLYKQEALPVLKDCGLLKEEELV
ncbi:MAG TPA: hypothetical protein VLB84_18890 [Bacteroidia bacterium]|nr:hypothetical protein [Bacteroidia bacterium]